MSSQNKSILVAIVGTGLVGAELVNQLLCLSRSQFKIVSLSSSKATLFAANGLAITQADWRAIFQQSAAPTILSALSGELQGLVKAGNKVVLVDNTSADSVAKMYPHFLAAGINVVTPNKKAFSTDQQLFEDITKASSESRARFLNESTVGAGLPIISTLKDLVATGDTEPHPGDDLNGADVARKLTILSRTIPALSGALPEGYKSVQTRSLVPPALTALATGDEFMTRLPEFDEEFDALRAEAQKEGKVLRYVGVVDVEKGIIKASLEKYENSHAFATSLGGSDNIIMFHTKRYGARPLTVQGAGAGAAVTSMGVLSDLLKLS
ncbi:hypothetical protein EW145_g361 [Phellinidium pouzarii]|uniref:homoserine dehydrogenase n=1 Tax=Phellinidium pouzarii TaxID=167371 RepID=A0A4S4LKL6_9AGAM|nr:hypothetical protein EW145_g361 [Phellinidium pouzarii]